MKKYLKREELEKDGWLFDKKISPLSPEEKGDTLEMFLKNQYMLVWNETKQHVEFCTVGWKK